MPGVVYLTITDTGSPDRPTAFSTLAATTASLHKSENVNGIDKMVSVDGMAVAPGVPVKLAPGGYHVMLEGLKQPLKAGDQFPLTLTFVHAGPVSTTVTAQPKGDTDMKGRNMM